jgi:hypothetical protein
MIKKILVIVVLFLAFQSCKVGTSGTFINENIDQNTRTEISTLNTKLFKALNTNNVAEVKAMMSDQLLEKAGGDIEKLVTAVNASLSAKDYKVLDEYNVKNSSTGISNTVLSGISERDYVVHYIALNKEMYVSLLLPNDIKNELLLTVIYGNYDNQWKINILQVGQYSLDKKTAPDFYAMAKKSYDKVNLVDAVNYATLAKQCLKPGANYFQYQKEKDIDAFYEKVLKEVNTKFKLPLTVEGIATKPKVFRIFPQVMSEGIFPSVCYLSTIDIKDTVALKTENEKVKIEISKLFPGIDKDKKAVLYRAFNELPDGKKEVKSFGFVDKK